MTTRRNDIRCSGHYEAQSPVGRDLLWRKAKPKQSWLIL